MSRLTYTSYYTRQVLKFGTLALILFFIGKTGFGIFKDYWLKIHPPPPPPPNTIFGKLPKINFPKKTKPKPESVSLETIDGSLPETPESERVYFIPQIGGRFLSLDKAGQLAESLGFENKPQKIDEDTFKFISPIKKTSLTIDVLAGNFVYTYDYLQDQTLINPNNLPNEPEAKLQADRFLQSTNHLSDDLNEGSREFSYWKTSGNKLVSAISASEADFIRVSIFRKIIDEKYKLLPFDANEALVSALISGVSVQSNQVVELKYTHFTVDREKSGTYPLKPISQAWQELEKGDYYLASFDQKSGQAVKIRSVELAYFDPQTLEKFLQPIFVFQGDQNFFGYVPAISSDWSE